jgi:hypothetical protein
MVANRDKEMVKKLLLAATQSKETNQAANQNAFTQTPW